MSPGAVEETGKVASNLISNLKDSPITLALILFNMAFLVIIYLGVKDQRSHLENYDNRMFEQQKQVMEMLYHCTPLRQPEQQQ